jgi:hypothetical protein
MNRGLPIGEQKKAASTTQLKSGTDVMIKKHFRQEMRKNGVCRLN